MSELPNGWAETSVFTISRPKQWKTISTKDLTSEGFPIYGANGIIGFYSSFTHETPTLMITCRGASCGNIHKSLPMSYINGNAMALDNLSSLINIDYLYYFLKSADFKNVISGSAQPQITQEGLQNLVVIIAPLNEQIRIADKLDSVLAKVDAAQARLEKIPTLLKRFRQSVLAAATSGELTKEWREKNVEVLFVSDSYDGQFQLSEETLKKYEIPETWRWVALGNYAKCNRGKFSVRPRNDPSCFEGDYPFIQIGDLPKDGGLVVAHNQTLNEKGLSVSKMFDAGTVVIAIVGATIANTGILRYPMCFPDSLVGINAPSETGNIYLDYYLRANKENIRQASYAGGGQPNIKLTVLNPLPLPLPPSHEQTEIVRRVESLFTLADTVEKQYLETKKRIDRLTQSLLAKAFRGELVPQDPNDEPAAELLKRIQAERNAQPPVKNKRKQQA